MLQNKKKISFSIHLFIALIILTAAITFLLQGFYYKASIDENKNSISRITFQADDLLSKFIRLQGLNEKYASILSNNNLDSADMRSLDSLNIIIADNQFTFQQLLDKLQKNRDGYTQAYFTLLIKITDAYITALEQSNALNKIRKAFTISNTNFNFDQNTISTIQNELHDKELEALNPTAVKVVKMPAYANNNFSKLVQQQDSVINEIMKSQKSRNEYLISYDINLKQNNERLNKTIDSLKSIIGQSKIISVATVSKTELDERLNLAQVDCYLLRADTKQIISNSKQRKELLQNALQLLNLLAQSDNTLIREQSQVKLQQLKTIAANDHD